MKKYICFAAALAIVGAASCNKELVDNNAPEVPEVKIATLTATIGEPDTKTTLAAPEDAHTSGSAVHWAAEDALSVFDGASNVKYTIKTKEDVDYTPAPTAVFEGTELAEAEGYYALYPYTETATLADGVIKGAVLPATQTAVAGNIPAGAALAVAYTEDRETINFKNVATIIGFTLTEAAEKVVFVAKGGVAIAGTIDVTFNKGLPTYTVQEKTGSSEVTLNNLEAGTYYFTILPDVTLAQGYEFYIGEELAKSKADELTLVRSKVYSLGEVKVPLKDRELSFSPASYEITWGDDFTEPTLKGTYTEVTYSSDNEEVATVDETTGEVTLNKAGTVTITATVAADETYNAGSAEYTLTIKKAARTISFSPNSSTATIGEEFTEPELTGEYEKVVFSSDDESVAIVDENGNVTAKKAGLTTIRVTVEETNYEGSASYSLTVVEPIYIYVKNDMGWGSVYLHAWEEKGVSDVDITTWPGEKLTETNTINKFEYVRYKLPSRYINTEIGFIFHDNSGKRLADYTIAINENTYLRLTPAGPVEIDPNDVTTFGYKIYIYDEDTKGGAKMHRWGSRVSDTQWDGVVLTESVDYNFKKLYYFTIDKQEYTKGFNFLLTVNQDDGKTGDKTWSKSNGDLYFGYYNNSSKGFWDMKVNNL